MKNSTTEQCALEDSQSPSPAKWWEGLTIDQYFEAASYCSSEVWSSIQNSAELPMNIQIKNK